MEEKDRNILIKQLSNWTNLKNTFTFSKAELLTSFTYWTVEDMALDDII